MTQFAGHLAEGVSEISESVGGFLKAQGSGARLFSLLDRDSFSNSGGISRTDNQIVVQTTLEDNQGQPMSDTLPSSYTPTIRFEKVQFSYPSHPDVPILNEVNTAVFIGRVFVRPSFSVLTFFFLYFMLCRSLSPYSMARCWQSRVQVVVANRALRVC